MAVAQRQDKGTPVGRTEVAFAGVKTKFLRNLRVGAALPAAIEAPNIGALIIRTRFWGPLYYTIVIIRNLQNSIGSD